MALLINSDGVQKEIDLNLESVIRTWGEAPVLHTELRLWMWLGLESHDEYECERLDDGRLLFHPSPLDGASMQVLLTHEESSLVETAKENTIRLMRELNADEAMVNRMTIPDVVPGGGGYSTSRAMVSVLGSNLVGIRLLIALLLAEKMKPAKAWRRSGVSAGAFLAEVERMRSAGVFSDWE